MFYDNVVLNSGGMDTFLMAQLHPQLQMGSTLHLFLDVGQKYKAKELLAAIASAHACNAHLEVVQLQDLGKYEHSSGIIPFRNAEFLLAAAQYANNLFMGVLAGEINSDKSSEFFRAMEAVLNISHRPQYWTEGRSFEIHTPVDKFTKSQLVNMYLGLHKPVEWLMQTVSCYSATDKHCGRCPSCFKRWVALVNNHVKFHGHFEQNPADWFSFDEWRIKARAYSEERRQEIASAFFLSQGWIL